MPQVCLFDSHTYENTLHVQIGKLDSSVLVDTGAPISCISNDLLTKTPLIYQISEI